MRHIIFHEETHKGKKPLSLDVWQAPTCLYIDFVWVNNSNEAASSFSSVSTEKKLLLLPFTSNNLYWILIVFPSSTLPPCSTSTNLFNILSNPICIKNPFFQTNSVKYNYVKNLFVKTILSNTTLSKPIDQINYV